MLRSHSSRGQDIEELSTACTFAPAQAKQISEGLVKWYAENKRDLPWRDQARWPQPAYAVWVSEMMLQQTRVQTVLDYFDRWMAKWPTVQALAAASEEEVNEMWSGLGYYRRARFLLQGAKEVVAKHGGELPDTAEGLKSLPGIGEYTAGAIASIAFNKQEPLVDGNVIRVLSRLQALADDPKAAATIKTHWRLARALVESHKEPSSLNQALMELGAMVCTPTTPDCAACPVAAQCLALKQQAADPAQLVTRFPTKVVKAAVRKQTLAVCIVTAAQEEVKQETAEDDGKGGGEEGEARMLLVRRPATGLLANLWEFPSVPVPEGAAKAKCTQTLAAYLTQAARVMAGGDEDNGKKETGRQKGQGKRAGAKRGKGKEKEEVASEGITYVGETSFLFSHIHQTMPIFALHLPSGHVLASRTEVCATAEVGDDAGKGKAKKGKTGKRARGVEEVVVIEDEDDEESEGKGGGARKGVQQEASAPNNLRWVPASGLEGAALPKVARKALEVFEQHKSGGTSAKKKRKKGVKEEEDAGKQKTISHFFSRIKP